MKLSTRQYGILLLGLFTASLHLAAAFDKILFKDGPDITFILNGLGYIGLLGAYFLPIKFFQDRHNLVRQVLIGYVIVTIVAWIWIWVIQYVIIGGENFFAHDSLYGVPAKIAEVIMLILLRSDKS